MVAGKAPKRRKRSRIPGKIVNLRRGRSTRLKIVKLGDVVFIPDVEDGRLMLRVQMPDGTEIDHEVLIVPGTP